MTEKYPNCTFMSVRALMGKPQLSLDEVDKVADSIKILADVFELSYEEIAERLSEFMTEQEFERVLEEIQSDYL